LKTPLLSEWVLSKYKSATYKGKFMEKKEGKNVANKLLLDTSSFFDLLLKNSHMTAIFVLNKSGQIVKVNAGVSKYYGYTPEEIIGKNFSLFLTKEDKRKAALDNELEDVLKNGSATDINYIIHKDGTAIWSQGETLCLNNNDDIYFVKIVHNVDQQRILEEFFIASEKKQTLLSRIFDSFLNGIEVFRCIRDITNEIIDFEYVLINKAAEKFMKKTRKEVIGKKLLDLYPDLKTIGVFDLQKRAVELGTSEEIEFFYDKQNLNGWFKASFGKFGDGLIVTLENITETKSVSSELQKTTTYLLDSQEIAKVGNLEWDIKNDKITGSPALYRLLGFEKAKITLSDYVKNICDEDRERVKHAIMNSMHRKKPSEIEYRFVQPDGIVRTFYVKAKTMFDENDEPSKIIGTIADITKLKKAEDRLKKAEDKLTKFSSDQQIVNERSEELLIANKQLKKIIEELDKYAYIISHDLRAPLNSLESLVFLLGEEYKEKPLDSYGEDMIDMINIKIQNMKELISQVLKSAKEDKKIKDPINLNHLTQQVIQTLAPPDNFQIHLEQEMPEIKYHKTSLIQILQNLIGNAIKYMDKQNPIIKVSCLDLTNNYEIKICDNGKGIPKRIIDKVFNLYEIGHTNENIESYGLGLSIVKKLVEENGGTIWIESEEGKGSDFHFTIPKVA
jgi:PAS domain S-box-containing protein